MSKNAYLVMIEYVFFQELIEIVKSLQSHNNQLKNIIAKSTTGKQKGKKANTSQRQFDFTTCSFRHVLLKIMYVGWDFRGYATQEDTSNTIEHYLFEALIKTCLIKDRNTSNYHRCGRTDKGVSSFGQVISIDLRTRLTPEQQHDLNSEIDYCNILNKVLPDTIQCIAWSPADTDYSARFNCTGRTYKYFFPKGNLNIEIMKTASTHLLGVHDFRNFCKMDVGNGVVKFVRNIVAIEISPFNTRFENEVPYVVLPEHSMYIITITGQAFLWHQIRCIMGVLFLIGQNRENPEIIQELLNVEDNPRKPDYNMASEVPLNLYHCEYDTGVQWKYDYDALSILIQKLQAMWTFSSVKSTMLEQMLSDLQTIYNQYNANNEVEQVPYINFLLNGVKAKTYIPLLQRQKCESLENRINHYTKRQKLEVLPATKTPTD